jgi:hypothetical protein
VVITTRDRPFLLREAVRSALAQSLEQIEVVVVDNASVSPVELGDDPRLHLVHRPGGGTAAARNAGLQASSGRWITCLDDDDQLLPHMAEVSLEALARPHLPAPVAVLSGVEVVRDGGEVLERRLPPSSPQGGYFGLDPLDPERSYRTKQTLVVERRVLLGIGGWDERLRSLVLTDLFLRLNPVCSLVGLSDITYVHVQHGGYRLSSDPALLQESFARLETKHRTLLEARPLGHARLLRTHAGRLRELGQLQAAEAVEGRASELESGAGAAEAAPAGGRPHP